MANPFCDNAMEVEVDGGRDEIEKGHRARHWCGGKMRRESGSALCSTWVYVQGHDGSLQAIIDYRYR